MKQLIAGFALLCLMAGNAYAAGLTFENKSAVSIPLEIPGVMNPNLNPHSKSGISLDKGQKVFFKYKGKRTLLLEITNQKDGETLVINELIAKRIEGIEKKKKMGTTTQ